MPVQYRPELHVTAETGVLNAPAGVLRDGDSWHVFYQFQPKLGAPKRWGHVISEEGPFDWTECDDVLAPVGGEIDLRAGSVVANRGGLDLYFTAVTAIGTKIQVAHMDLVERVCEVSDEPAALDPAVARVSEVVSDRPPLTNFRSPCVVHDWEKEEDRDAGHEGWLMLAVTGDMDDPVPVILTSPDAKEWGVVGALEFAGDHGLASTKKIVAPRILRLRDEVDEEIYDILLITLERDGREISGYLVGHLDRAVFHVSTPFTRLDHGYDFTRPRNTNYTPGTVDEEKLYDDAVVFGLLNGTGRLDDPSTHLSLQESDWANVLSLPRVLTLQRGKIYQAPYSGLPDAIASSDRARSWIGMLEVPTDDDASTVTVEVLGDDDEVAFRITHSGHTLSVDRSMNPHHSGDEPLDVELREDDSDSLSIFVDGSTVEVYADGGQVALASRAYINGGSPSYRVRTTGEAQVHRAYEHSARTSKADLLGDLEELEQFEDAPDLS